MFYINVLRHQKFYNPTEFLQQLVTPVSSTAIHTSSKVIHINLYKFYCNSKVLHGPVLKRSKATRTHIQVLHLSRTDSPVYMATGLIFPKPASLLVHPRRYIAKWFNGFVRCEQNAPETGHQASLNGRRGNGCSIFRFFSEENIFS